MKDVYQLSDLENRAILDEGAEFPARLAVIGHPIAHSASPQMHQAVLDAAGLGMRYIRLDIEPGQLDEAFKQMASLGFVGCNITVPHKLEALRCCDELTEDARVIGSVNTILFDEDSSEDGKVKLLGHNTDAPGLARAIYEEFGVDLGDLRVMILGAGGGAGRAIATQCARLGCGQLWLVNRTVEKAEKLKEKLQTYYDQSERLAGPGESITVLSPDDRKLDEAAGHADLIINATPLGMRRTDPLPLPETCLQPHHLVYDAIYKPPVTALMERANQRGARTANGLSMLLHQGALAFDFWFPGKSDISLMKQALADV